MNAPNSPCSASHGWKNSLAACCSITCQKDAEMSESIGPFVIAGAAIETDDSLKPSLATEGQSKMHLPSTVWKQPKDTKDWGDEYISKEQPERGKDMGQSRYSSADNIICEPSLAGKE